MRRSMTRSVDAVITVEAAVVMGVALIGLALLLRISLYLHDKSVVSGTVMESVQVARERERADIEGAVSEYFAERMQGKLLYFPTPVCSVSKTGDMVRIRAQAANGILRLDATAGAPLIDPEEEIRNKQQGGTEWTR